VENQLKDIPSSRCLPSGIMMGAGQGRFVHTPAILVMLVEGEHPRQVFLDGRSHPKDLPPTWLGHSVGHWEGDTLVVETVGFNGQTWLDFEGHPHTERLRVIERYRRPDLGHLELELTVEDPGALQKPWTQKRASNLTPSENILEFICNENERDLEHLVGK
jgi:hypothetical protein